MINLVGGDNNSRGKQDNPNVRFVATDFIHGEDIYFEMKLSTMEHRKGVENNR